jgi:hypothetical protein
MNPSDLLLTNQFITGREPEQSNASYGMAKPFDISRGDQCVPINPSLEHLNNVKENREHRELKEYLKNELHNSGKYKKNNSATDNTYNEYNTNYDVLSPSIRNPGITANLDLPKWIYDKQNISLSSSVQPVFNNLITDLKKVRYRKNVRSYLNIDSRQRDTVKYPNPAKYNIFLNKEFKYLQSIELVSIEFRDAPTPINSRNNCFIWITNYTGLEGVEPGTKVEYRTIIPSAYYTLDNFVQVIETIAVNTVQHNLPGNILNGKFPNFDIYISPFNRSLMFIQRIENYIINSIKTTANSNIVEIRINNRIQCCNDLGEDCADCKNKCGDITPPFKPDTETVPIIIGGLSLFGTGFGNIPDSMLNIIPFYPESVTSNSECLYNTYTYGRYEEDCCEFIYYLHVYTRDGVPAVASTTKKTCLQESKLQNNKAGHSSVVNVGRALSFEVVTSCGGSFGNFLGLTTANTDVLVNTNIDSQTFVVKNQIPWRVVGTGELSLATDDYIYMRLETPSKPVGTISDNLSSARGCNINTDIVDLKDENYFFAKIIFSDKAPGDVSILSVGGQKFFYDAFLVSLTDLSVEFFDRTGNLLDLYQNHSFTLEITEIKEILKDTLIDSRTGNISDYGSSVSTIDVI